MNHPQQPNWKWQPPAGCTRITTIDLHTGGEPLRVITGGLPWRLRHQAGWRVVNVDSTIIAQAPKMAPYIPAMIENIAADLLVAGGDVNVKAKTCERLGFAGRGEGIVAEAVVLISHGG